MSRADRPRMGLTEILATADGVTHYFAKRVAWASANVEDLRQEVRLAILKARTTFDPRVASNEEAYLWQAGDQSARRYIWKQRFPVSGGTHDPARQLGSLRVVHLDAPSGDEDGASALGEARAEGVFGRRVDGGQEPAWGSPERRLIRRQWRSAVRSRLNELADPSVVATVLEIAPNASAEDERLAKMLRRRILSDPTLYRLSLENPE